MLECIRRQHFLILWFVDGSCFGRTWALRCKLQGSSVFFILEPLYRIMRALKNCPITLSLSITFFSLLLLDYAVIRSIQKFRTYKYHNAATGTQSLNSLSKVCTVPLRERRQLYHRECSCSFCRRNTQFFESDVQFWTTSARDISKAEYYICGSSSKMNVLFRCSKLLCWINTCLQSRSPFSNFRLK